MEPTSAELGSFGRSSLKGLPGPELFANLWEPPPTQHDHFPFAAVTGRVAADRSAARRSGLNLLLFVQDSTTYSPINGTVIGDSLTDDQYFVDTTFTTGWSVDQWSGNPDRVHLRLRCR